MKGVVLPKYVVYFGRLEGVKSKLGINWQSKVPNSIGSTPFGPRGEFGNQIDSGRNAGVGKSKTSHQAGKKGMED
jgi:hypothetical protein